MARRLIQKAVGRNEFFFREEKEFQVTLYLRYEFKDLFVGDFCSLRIPTYNCTSSVSPYLRA